MKKNLRLAVLSTVVFIMKVNAQCDLKATILPVRPILCPNGTDTLYTQEYDTYQWYKNKHLIPGATQRGYVITQDDVGYAFNVAVTKNGCADTSRRVVVDGYVFLLPYVIETGDVGVYDPSRDALIECPDDTLILTLGDPYTLSIQWYDNYKAIKGANEQTYYVTNSGSYTVCGAPEVCPQYNACETVPINVVFESPVATISEKNDTLFASKAKQYQWFFNGKKIPGATERYYVPNAIGKYKVSTVDKYTCVAVSDPYLYATARVSKIISVAPNPVKDILHLLIEAPGAIRLVLFDLYGNRVLQTAIKVGDNTISLQSMRPGTYIMQVLDKQNKMISSATIIKE
ncbi:MAG TPA: T9SS type A sorting domain-containing protein [Parafilimonas sp.]|nr:T9SS type A sorting domain-containing protein [Parafilimonas sp.]